jgi:hypothetical protein
MPATSANAALANATWMTGTSTDRTLARGALLTKTNYAEWSMVMKVKMQARRMCNVIRYIDTDFDEDRRALEALLAAVPLEMHSSLANKETVNDA